MRRSERTSALTAILLTAWSVSTAAQSAAPVTYSSDGDLGGSLSVEVPKDAAPAGTTIAIMARAASQRPDDLGAVPMEWTFYELQPSDLRFSAPLTVTRSISFEELGMDRFDPVFDGLIVGALFTRDAGGSWSWLEDAQVRLEVADASFSVTGITHHGGPILAYVPGDLLVATEDEAATPVGETFRVEGQIRVDPTSRADIVAVSGRSSDESIATPGRSYDVASFDRAMGLEYQCLAPGTVAYETTFAAASVNDVSPLDDAIGLAGTDVSVTHSGEHTCE